MLISTGLTKSRVIAVALWCVPIITIAIVFRKIFFFGHFFFNGDSLLQFYQYFVLLKRGAPWVTSEILGGYPLYASVNGMWFYPVNRWLLAFFDVFTAYHVLIAIDMVLAYACAYGAARSLSIRRESSIAAGLIYLFSGQMMMWATVIQNTNYYFLLPAVVWLLEAGKRWKRQWLSYVLSGFLLGIGWLSGHVQLIAFIHLFAAAYLLFRIVQPMRLLRSGSAGLIVFGISAGIGLVQNLPILLFAPYTARSNGVGLGVFFSEGYGLQDLIHYLLPFWDSSVLPAPVPNLYLGILPFLLLFGTFFIPRKARGSGCNFFLVVFLVSFLTAFKYSPLGFLLYQLPFFDSFRQLPRAMLVGNFAAAIVIGFTIDRLHEYREVMQPKLAKLVSVVRRVTLYVLLPVAVLATVTYRFFRPYLTDLLIAYFREYRYAGTAQLPFEHYARVIEQSVHDALYQFSLFDPAVVTALAMLVLSLVLLRSWYRLDRSFIQIAVILLIAANAVAVYGGRFQTLPREALSEIPRSARSIRSFGDSDAYRIYSLFTGVTEYNELSVGCPEARPEDHLAFQKEFLVPNLNILWELDSIDGYENFMTARIAEMLAYLGSERATKGELLVEEKIPLEERADKVLERKSLLEALNVRYLMSPVPLDAPGVIEVDRYEVSSCSVPLYMYRFESAWPRYFLTRNVRAYQIDSEPSFADLRESLLASVDAGAVFIETNGAIPDGTGQRTPLEPSMSDTERTFTIEQEEQSLLYIGDAWLPGWKAEIDDQPAEIYHANFAAMAVWVPAGSHKVRLSYKVSPLEW